MMFKIAFRSIFRNRRRSIMTLSTIMVGCASVLIFGAYVTYVLLGLQTGTVQRNGHLTVFRKGYFLFGSGNPGAYGIEDYAALIQQLGEDPILKARVAVMTPMQSIAGIAGNFANDTSKPFFGVGYVPSDRARMGEWNPYDLSLSSGQRQALRDDDPLTGVVGIGLGRILGLCAPLQIEDCPQAPVKERGVVDASPLPSGVLSELAVRDRPQGAAAQDTRPHIDLLAATTGGAPNVVSLAIARTESQAVREMDDSYVGMHLKLAQQLLYGRGTPKVTGIVLQLHRTEDMPLVRETLGRLIAERKLDLEVRDFGELVPMYNQIIGFIGSIFAFISTIIGVVVLFTVTNTIGMSIMERTDEIGTTRALGLRRKGIRFQFLMEGWVLGVIGATGGLILAALVTYLVNHGGITWIPPGQVRPVPLRLYLFARPSLVAGTWIGLVIVATVSAYLPANRAAKLPVVDALRHV